MRKQFLIIMARVWQKQKRPSSFFLNASRFSFLSVPGAGMLLFLLVSTRFLQKYGY